VINLSLGGPEPSVALRDALKYAVSKGAFVSIAMGNDYEEGNPVDYPAAYAAELDGVMSVGALGPSRRALSTRTRVRTSRFRRRGAATVKAARAV
jgi:Subtilase family.